MLADSTRHPRETRSVNRNVVVAVSDRTGSQEDG